MGPSDSRRSAPLSAADTAPGGSWQTGVERAGGILHIDLAAIAANYRLLQSRLTPGCVCGAVVKADAYGLGMARVAPTLHAAGCRDFFVALLDEAIVLRALLPDAEIHVFAGATAATADEFLRHRLIPVLNHLGQIADFTALARRRGESLAADIHIDTGMNRLGLPEAELARLGDRPDLLDGLSLRTVVSHLACADEPGHPLNGDQRTRFAAARRRLPAFASVRASLANSGGIFLGPDFHADLARPGAALYGLAPHVGAPNPMAQPIRLQGRILQVRDVDSPMTVGYGAAHRVTAKGRIATVGIGYADGYLQALTNRGHAYIDDIRVPVVGRVSMDLITLDVSQVPPARVAPNGLVELIGPHCSPDTLAKEAGTIGYEILTSLGSRYPRLYTNGDSGAAA
jgi:alanine racemase